MQADSRSIKDAIMVAQLVVTLHLLDLVTDQDQESLIREVLELACTILQLKCEAIVHGQ